MEINFKFDLGQIVTTAESVFSNKRLQEDPRTYKTSIPIPLVIETRFAEECPGGIQLFYLCSYYSGEYKQHKFLEQLLVPYPEKPEQEKQADA